jgi:hypothetical protein
MSHRRPLRDASIQTPWDVYVQRIDQSVIEAVNSRTAAVLDGWHAPAGAMGQKGRNSMGLEVIRRSLKRRFL